VNLERQYRELKKLEEKVRQWEGKNWSRRSIERQSVWRDVLLSIPGHITSEPCVVRDLSNRGAGIQLNGLTLLPTEFPLSFDEFRTTYPFTKHGPLFSPRGARYKAPFALESPYWRGRLWPIANKGTARPRELIALQARTLMRREPLRRGVRFQSSDRTPAPCGDRQDGFCRLPPAGCPAES
jgi:hypothetical protein